MERDGLHDLCLDIPIDFNSHAHVERDPDLSGLTESPLYFNSHAHVERDDIIYLFIYLAFISTHTLTWSVTR